MRLDWTRWLGFSALILVGALGASGCADDATAGPQDGGFDGGDANDGAVAMDASLDGARPDATADSGEGDAAAPVGPLSIASWDIQTFGATKAGDATLLGQIAGLVAGYHLVAVQEIKDATETAPVALLDGINGVASDAYAMSLSPRLGGVSKEQYAFYYDTSELELVGSAAVYPDPGASAFERPPWAARFRSLTDSTFDFVAVTVHTNPSNALAEIEALADVVNWAQAQFGDSQVVVLGDLNADCTYASTAELDMLDIRGTSYVWAIGDDADTVVSDTVDCAYDRIIFTESFATSLGWSGGGVDASFTDTGISDHWPVTATVGSGP